MASPSTIITLGLGLFGSVNLLPTLGYGVGVQTGGGGDSGLKYGRVPHAKKQKPWVVPWEVPKETAKDSPGIRSHRAVLVGTINRVQCKLEVRVGRAAKPVEVVAVPTAPPKLRHERYVLTVTLRKPILRLKAIYVSPVAIEQEDERLMAAILNNTPIEAVFMR